MILPSLENSHNTALLQARKEISSCNVDSSSQSEDNELCKIDKQLRYSSSACLMASVDNMVSCGRKQLTGCVEAAIAHESWCRETEGFTFLCYNFYSH